MKRIGIITQYYRSINYGGNLQSYALCVVLNNMDYSAEQICYSYKREKGNGIFQIMTRKGVKEIGEIVYRKVRTLFCKKDIRGIEKSENLKQKAFYKFNNELIPHSKNVYFNETIAKVKDEYEIFITGSDQVWNVDVYNSAYRLDFVSSDKYKFSYAAGISSGNLKQRDCSIFKNTFNSYSAISVREKESVDVLQPLTEKKVEWVLDPTMLLTDKQWDVVCSQRKVQGKYVFCYFLGSPPIDVGDIVDFAKKNGLKIVNFPYACGTSSHITDFGDYRVYDASPQDFLSYIKHAEYVFTDSFHASVFSHIYKRNFFVFNRKGFKAMNDRIYSLTELFDTGDRFCDSKEKCTLKYIESLPSINYDREFPKFEAMKEKSINFLKENLKKAEEKLDEIDGI